MFIQMATIIILCVAQNYAISGFWKTDNLGQICSVQRAQPLVQPDILVNIQCCGPLSQMPAGISPSNVGDIWQHSTTLQYVFQVSTIYFL